MQRNYMIEAHETLIRIAYLQSTRSTFAYETPSFGRVFSTEAVLDELGDDDIMRVIRMNTSTYQTEEITEECAKAYIEDWNNRIAELDETDEAKLPAFVKYSQAWAAYKDDLEAMQTVKPRRSQAIRMRVYSALEAGR